MKRTRIKRKAYTIKKVSEKQEGRLTIYKKLRANFLKANPTCDAALEGCTKTATDIHHMKGRENDMLNNMSYWISVCRSCHRKITDNTKMALEAGLSYSKHTK